MINKIFNEDCLETMKRMEDNYIDLTVTSPPYDNLRTYKGYSFDFESIAKELYRVTKLGGVVVWIVNDKNIKGSESGTSFKQVLYFKEIGFNLHDTMIWQKPNFSNPSSNRYHQVFDYMFILSKGNPKTFNPLKDRKNICANKKTFGKVTHRDTEGNMIKSSGERKEYKEFGMRHNIWMHKTTGQENPCKAIKHPATFPIGLIKDHIRSWSKLGDIVYDPFMGSGTTAKAAIESCRKYIGSDISKEYCIDAEENLQSCLY